MIGQRLKTLIRILLGITILFWIFYRIGFGRIADSLMHLNLWAVPLAAVCFVLYLFFSSLGSWVLLRPFSRLALSEFLPCFLSSWAIGLFLPGKLGEASIVYFLKKKDLSIGIGTAFFVVGKTVTILGLGLIAATGFFTFFVFRVGLQLFLILLLLIAVFFFMLLSDFGKRVIRKVFPRKIQEMFTGFLSAFSDYFKAHKGKIGLSLIFKLAAISCVAVMNSFIFAVGLDVRIAVYKILQVNAMETFSALIPISINGLGVRQALGIYLFGRLGVEAPLVASSQIVGWVLIYIFGVVSLLFRLGPVDPPSQVDL